MFRLEDAYDHIEDLYVKHIKLDKEK